MNDDAMHLPGNSLSGYGLDDDRRCLTMLALLSMDVPFLAVVHQVKARYRRPGCKVKVK